MNQLSTYLAASKTSVRRFAKASDVSPAYLSALAHGKCIPSVNVAARIEAASGGEVPISSWITHGGPLSVAPEDPTKHNASGERP